MKQPNAFHYFRVKAPVGAHPVEFLTLKEFHRFAENNHHKSVLLITGEDDKPTHFAVIHNGALLQKACENFKALEDFLDSYQHHFPDASSYYDSQQMGYNDYEDYKLVKEAGIDDKEVFKKLKDQGFIAGFDEYKTLRNENPLPAESGTIENPYQLYQLAKKNNFLTYAHFKEAWLKGFADATLYKIATEKGYKTKTEYDEGSNAGFVNALDYYKAKELKVRDNKDFERLIELEFLAHTGYAYDQRVMLVLISKLPQNKKVSINKIDELFKKACEEYRYEETGEMPLWFTSSFTDRASVISFLSASEHIKKYGNYDNDGEYFETNHLQERKVVLDGSNVAHNTKGGNQQSKAFAFNIVRMVNELKQRGFTEITVIADASLKHKLVDRDILKQLKEMVEYLDAPAEESADVFIIQYVKRHRCLLVSNDTFHEWKIRDRWVAENIDYYRLSFLINSDSVLLPDLN